MREDVQHEHAWSDWRMARIIVRLISSHTVERWTRRCTACNDRQVRTRAA